jgi:hypothetical protein
MNHMLIRSQMPAPFVAPPAGQHRVCHRRMHSERLRGISRTTCTNAASIAGFSPDVGLTAGIGMHARLDQLQSP